MSEAPNEAPEDEAPLLSDLYILKRLGWSATQSKGYIRHRTFSRMQLFEETSRSRQEVDEKVLKAAYYALELSTSLPEYDEAVGAMNNLQDPGSEVNERIIDNYIIAITVHKLLAQALRKSREPKPVVSSRESSRTGSDTQSHLRLVPELTPELKTERAICLTAIERMAEKSNQLGWISPGTAREAKAILEILIEDSLK